MILGRNSRSQAAPVRVREPWKGQWLVAAAAVSVEKGRVDTSIHETKKASNHLPLVAYPMCPHYRILALNVPYLFAVNLFVKVLSFLGCFCFRIVVLMVLHAPIGLQSSH